MRDLGFWVFIKTGFVCDALWIKILNNTFLPQNYKENLVLSSKYIFNLSRFWIENLLLKRIIILR